MSCLSGSMFIFFWEEYGRFAGHVVQAKTQRSWCWYWKTMGWNSLFLSVSIASRLGRSNRSLLSAHLERISSSAPLFFSRKPDIGRFLAHENRRIGRQSVAKSVQSTGSDKGSRGNAPRWLGPSISLVRTLVLSSADRSVSRARGGAQQRGMWNVCA